METSKDFWQFTAYRKRELTRVYEAIKAALEESEFDKLHSEGKSLTLEQGTAYALEMIDQ